MKDSFNKLKIICWKWNSNNYRTKFTEYHVNILKWMIDKNIKIPYDLICITDDPSGIDDSIQTIKLWENPAPNYGKEDKPNCHVRLKCFSEEFKNIINGNKFVSIDLDTIIVSDITDLLIKDENFCIWKPDTAEMPCNGSFFVHKCGTKKEIWQNFDPKQIDPLYGIKYKTGLQGSDQAWIALHLKKDDYIFGGKKDGIYSFRQNILDKKNELPKNAKIVFFNGCDKPWHDNIRSKYSWVKEFYPL